MAQRDEAKPKGATRAKARRDAQGALLQVAALPVRRDAEGAWRLLLVTSRETRRWVVPKGWPMKGLKDRKAAGLEAKQEAGVVGRVGKAPLGSYLYWKRRSDRFDLCRVEVYRLDVERQLTRWKEKGQREARWFTPDEAALSVDEPGLTALLQGLDLDLDERGAGHTKGAGPRTAGG
jgi:ADP-ribose pyrophosphatase YjhB (NUDIX family)